MLPKANRIKRKKDFEAIFRNAKSLKNSFFVLKIAKNNLGLNRFGFVVSQKVSKKATARNKVRRRLAEVIRNIENKIKIGTDLVFIILPGGEKKELPEIKNIIEEALFKAGLIEK